MIFITHEKSVGRSGHQFKDAISPILIAEIFGFTYVYTHYRSLELFNLGCGNLRREDIDIPVYRIEGPHWKGVRYDQLMSDFSAFQRSHQEDCLIVLANSYRVQLFQAYQWYKNGQLHENVYQSVVSRLRENFHAQNPRPEASHTRDKVLVAVHIRRGDVTKDRRRRVPSSQHYVHEISLYDSILRCLQEQIQEQELDIHIYTEFANSEDVASYCRQRPDLHLHQGARPEFAEHFCAMVYSDILVVSNSSMSQMAGYLCEGLKIYYPNNHYDGLPEDEFLPVQKLRELSVPVLLAKTR